MIKQRHNAYFRISNIIKLSEDYLLSSSICLSEWNGKCKIYSIYSHSRHFIKDKLHQDLFEKLASNNISKWHTKCNIDTQGYRKKHRLAHDNYDRACKTSNSYYKRPTQNEADITPNTLFIEENTNSSKTMATKCLNSAPQNKN